MKIIIVLVLMSFNTLTLACSIFCAAKQGEVLAAGNEDWSDPVSKMWVRPAKQDSYGSINFAHSDYQVQTAINEYGLFYDYAAIEKVEGKNLKGKILYKGDLFSEILAKCKTIDEALVYLNKYQYPSAYHQVLLADADGQSVIVNQDAIILKDLQDHQVITNFNATEIKSGQYQSPRFEIINNGLSKEKSISVDSFRSLISRSHQEGEYPTQYSYIFDLKRGIINLYSFHNYENAIVLNIKDKLNKGYDLINLKELFPLAFEEAYFKSNHSSALKHKVLNIIHSKGVNAGMEFYQTSLKENPEKVKFPDLLLEVAADLFIESWLQESQGIPFEYWWHPEKILQWKPSNITTINALTFYKKIEETATGNNPFELIGAYEMIGLIHYLQGDKSVAKEYFTKTLNVAPIDSGNYKRAKQMLDLI